MEPDYICIYHYRCTLCPFPASANPYWATYVERKEYLSGSMLMVILFLCFMVICSGIVKI